MKTHTAEPAPSPTGMLLCDVVQAVGSLSWREYQGQCPYPALVELPCGLELPEAGDAEAMSRERLDRLADRLAQLQVHYLVGGAEPIVVGRRRAGVVLRGRDVSAAHAELSQRDGTWRVRDLESCKGTRIEGRRAPVGIPLPVAAGQVLTFGETPTLFLEPQQVYSLTQRARRQRASELLLPPQGMLLKRVLAGVARTALPGPESGPFLLQVPLQGERASGDPGSLTQLVSEAAIQGASRSRSLEGVRLHTLRPVHGGHFTLVGRGSGCDVVLPEASASREHARLWIRAGRNRLLDLGSQNGTFLQGSRVPAGVTAEVREGQTIQFGRYQGMLLGWEQARDLLSMLMNRERAACAA